MKQGSREKIRELKGRPSAPAAAPAVVLPTADEKDGGKRREEARKKLPRYLQRID
jgi:hypothetical protein